MADYSQIELRVLAHMCGDPGWSRRFEPESTCTPPPRLGCRSLTEGGVTREQRNTAKMINFGLLYGMEAFGLADRLGISRDEARDHIDAYFAQFGRSRTTCTGW